MTTIAFRPDPYVTVAPAPVTNRIATASWITAVLVPPVGLVLGLIGLRRSGVRSGVGRTESIVGIVVAPIAAVCWVVLLGILAAVAIPVFLNQKAIAERDSTPAQRHYLAALDDSTRDAWTDASLVRSGLSGCRLAKDGQSRDAVVAAEVASGLSPADAESVVSAASAHLCPLVDELAR